METTPQPFPPEDLESDDSDFEVDLENYEAYAPPKPFFMQFQQQRLPTFYLAPTVTFTLGALAVSWVICGLMSAVYLTQNKNFIEHTVRYDDVNKYQFPTADEQNDPSLLKSATVQVGGQSVVTKQGRQAVVTFTLSETIPGPVSMFYIIDPFYQNFRSYAESVDDSQLLGNVRGKDALFGCSPLRSPGEYYPKGDDLLDTPITADGQQYKFADILYNPCGARPWSMFNDTVVVEQVRTDGLNPKVCTSDAFDAKGERHTLTASQNPCRKRNIAWDIDYERHQPAATGPTIWSRNYRYTTDNDFLTNGWYFNEAGHSLPDPEDEDLISWLATSSTSHTKKVWRIIERDMESHDTNGVQIVYRLTIDEYFPTFAMGAEKRIQFMGGSSKWLEAPNPRIVYPLLATAGFSFIAFVLILAGCLISRRKGSNSASDSISTGPLTPVGEGDVQLDALSKLLAKYRKEPSRTLEESLEPNSYESGMYVELCARRQLDWERQKREAKGYKAYKRAKALEKADADKNGHGGSPSD